MLNESWRRAIKGDQEVKIPTKKSKILTILKRNFKRFGKERKVRHKNCNPNFMPGLLAAAAYHTRTGLRKEKNPKETKSTEKVSHFRKFVGQKN